MSAIFVLVAAGCPTPSAPPAPEPAPPRLQREPNLLQIFIEPSGSEPQPPAFHDAEVQFEPASIVYRQKRFLEAAQGFLAAARLLLNVEGFYVSFAKLNRMSCYYNAWSAYSAADQRPAGRVALDAAAESDPALAAEIRALIRER